MRVAILLVVAVWLAGIIYALYERKKLTYDWQAKLSDFESSSNTSMFIFMLVLIGSFWASIDREVNNLALAGLMIVIWGCYLVLRVKYLEKHKFPDHYQTFNKIFSFALFIIAVVMSLFFFNRLQVWQKSVVNAVPYPKVNHAVQAESYAPYSCPSIATMQKAVQGAKSMEIKNWRDATGISWRIYFDKLRWPIITISSFNGADWSPRVHTLMCKYGIANSLQDFFVAIPDPTVQKPKGIFWVSDKEQTTCDGDPENCRFQTNKQ